MTLTYYLKYLYFVYNQLHRNYTLNFTSATREGQLVHMMYWQTC